MGPIVGDLIFHLGFTHFVSLLTLAGYSGGGGYGGY